MISADKRILKAAEEVFAEKGYDGASVNEIAKRADISKTQIFYYFKSKKELFDELIKNHIKDGMNYRNEIWKNINPSSENDKTEAIVELAEALEKKTNIMRIGLIEAFKNSSDDLSLFKLMDPVIKDTFLKLKNKKVEKIEDDSDIEFIIKFLFKNMMPLYTFYILNDKFSDYYGIDREKSKKIFFKAAKESLLRFIEES